MSYKGLPIYLMSPVNSTMKSAIDSFHEIWLPMHSKEDELVLYHYSNLKGIMGIFESKGLWCTDTSSSNDPMELKYGKKLISDILVKRIESESNNAIIELLYNLNKFIATFME